MNVCDLNWIRVERESSVGSNVRSVSKVRVSKGQVIRHHDNLLSRLGLSRGEAPLGAFLQNIFPARQWPLLKDEANTKGFLHRQYLRRSQKCCPGSSSLLETLPLQGTASIE